MADHLIVIVLLFRVDRRLNFNSSPSPPKAKKADSDGERIKKLRLHLKNRTKYEMLHDSWVESDGGADVIAE